MADTTDARNVCAVDSGMTIQSLAYHGDNVADSFYAPDHAQYAIELDAYTFASNH